MAEEEKKETKEKSFWESTKDLVGPYVVKNYNLYKEEENKKNNQENKVATLSETLQNNSKGHVNTDQADVNIMQNQTERG